MEGSRWPVERELVVTRPTYHEASISMEVRSQNGSDGTAPTHNTLELVHDYVLLSKRIDHRSRS